MDRKIEMIVLHCSASSNPKHDDIEVIRDWHINGNGWNDVGYHFFIKRNSQLQLGRDLEIIGAHAKGYNKNSVGVCLSGINHFTTGQIGRAVNLINVLLEVHELDKSCVVGHYELTDKKTCPNIDMDWFRDKLD